MSNGPNTQERHARQIEHSQSKPLEKIVEEMGISKQKEREIREKVKKIMKQKGFEFSHETGCTMIATDGTVFPKI